MKNIKKLIWGLLLIALAVFIILNQIGVVNVVIGTMHLILGVLVMFILVESLLKINFPGIFLSLGILWIIFDEYITDYEISEFLVIIAAILLAIGFSLIWPKAGKRIICGKWADYSDVNKMGKHQKTSNEEKDGYVYCSNSMGASAKYINCTNLKYANLSNSFGELQVYFDNAMIDGEQAEIRVENSFGELIIYLPSEWRVEKNINVFAASVSEKGKRNSIVEEKSVILTGSTSFGEVQVKYV